MLELQELTKRTLELFNCPSVSDLGDYLMIALEDEGKLDDFCSMIDNDLSKDWLQKIYQYYLADRKNNKQDYTPSCLARFLSRLVGESSETIDMCSGDGALVIQRWVECPDTTFCCYEIDEKVIPFLLFNLVVRNIPATVNRGDVLQGEICEVWKVTKGEKYGKVTRIKPTLQP